MEEEVKLEDKTLKELQDQLTAMDFEGAEYFNSKAQVISVIKSLQKKVEKAEKIVEDNTPLVNDNVKEDRDHYVGKAEKMRNHLMAQPKVPYAIPLGIGEKKGAYETWQCNGYRLSIMKGVIVHLPKQVVESLMESYTETAEAGSTIPNNRGGQGLLIESDEKTKERLQMA